jgi:RNA exonuclease 4
MQSDNCKSHSKKDKKETKKINNTSSVSAEEYLSFDVECVATGYGHLDRAPVSICIVNSNEEVVFHEVFCPDVQVRSYLTFITGFSEADLAGKRTFSEVLSEVLPRYFNPNVVLVGQGIKNDIRWLKLVQGTHYKRFIDLADIFCVEYHQNGTKKTRKFALRHVAEVLLDVENNTTMHSAEQDALHSMRLFKLYGETGKKAEKLLKQAKHKLHQSKPTVEQLEIPDVTDDGVCCCGYRPHRCQCGQPSLTEVLKDPGALHRDYLTIDSPCNVSTRSVPLSRPTFANAALPPPAPPLPPSAAVVTSAPLTMSASPATPSITVPRVNNGVRILSTSMTTRTTMTSNSSICHDLPSPSSSMYEAMRRGTFNPHENYDDDYDNIYGDFYGNYGGRDS